MGDRDGLGALTDAIKDFLGGVIIISHNREFANAVAEEKWIMEAGHLRQEGESLAKGEEEDTNAQKEDILDASGNKAEIKRIEKQLKDNKKKKSLSDEDQWALEDKLAELKVIVDEDKAATAAAKGKK